MKTRSKKSAVIPVADPPEARVVHFEFHDPGAHDVCLAGTFNDWHPSATPMVNMGYGRWAKELTLTPGVYEYLFVVNGRWLPDPGAAVTLPNPFGGINCCVKVD
jgi:1,4-alpha-glucan branching enzyme